MRVSSGATAVTAILSPPSPTASVRVIPISVPFGATYGSIGPSGELQNVFETMKITRPNPRSRLPGANAGVSSSADSTLTA